MDVLVPTTMKNAAKCDTKSELQISVNLYVFERMLRFRVLLEACLFECLFSPLASLDQHLHFGGGGEREVADCGLSDSSSSRSTQVERRRVFTHVSERCNPFSKPMWCAASVVTKLVWKKTRRARSRTLRIVRALPPKTVLGHWRDYSTFGPQIRQEDPLNLSI